MSKPASHSHLTPKLRDRLRARFRTLLNQMSDPIKSDSEREADSPPVPCSPFVVEPHMLQFRCDTAVYRQGSGTSVCYVASQEAGDFVAAALNYFHASGEMDKFIEANDQ